MEREIASARALLLDDLMGEFPFTAQARGCSMETYLIVFLGLVAIAVIFVWTYGRRASTRNIYKAKWEKLRGEGHSEKECSFRLLSTRPGWKNLPPPFLRELSDRLGSWENIADFIHLSERGLADREAYPQIALSDPHMESPDDIMQAVARALLRCDLQNEKASLLASLIAPKIQPQYSICDLVSVVSVADKTMDIVGEFGQTLETLGNEGYSLLYPISRLPFPKDVIRNALDEAVQVALPGKFKDSIDTACSCLDRFVPDEEIPETMDTDDGFEEALRLIQKNRAARPFE